MKDKLIFELHDKVNSLIENQALILLMLNDMTNNKYVSDVKNAIDKLQKKYEEMSK